MGDVAGDINVTTEDGVTRALEALRGQISGMEHDKTELEKKLLAAREEERLLQRLLELRRGTRVNAEPGGESSTQRNTDNYQPSALSAVKEELSAAGRPLHISELMRLLHDRKIPIPGAGAQANLIAHMRRNKDIVRPSRGMYALAAWGLKDIPTKSGRRRRRRVRARADSKEQ